MIWKLLFGQTSRDHGSLGYFKSLLNRLPVKKDPKKDVNACLDFLLTVVKGHLLAAACSFLGIDTLDSPVHIPADVRRGSSEEKYTFVKTVATHVVNSCTVIEGAITGKQVPESGDGVHNYAQVLCHYGAMVMEFLDAWHEGDGERVYHCWRLFLPHFIVSNRRKYALEALRLQMQVKAMLSPHLAHHIMWDRFINTRGGMGKNIPCDLHNEHVNKLLKHVITSMGGNLTEVALRRASRSVSTLEAVCQQFDKCSGVPFTSSSHSTLSDMQDVGKVMKTVIKRELLSIVSGRKHAGFPTISRNPLKAWDMDKTEQWVESKKTQFLKYRGAVQEPCDDSDSESESDD